MLKGSDTNPPQRACKPRWWLALQTVYAGLFTGLFVLPNLMRAPSLVMVVLATLAAVWIIGCLAAFLRWTRSDELMLCGSSAPVILGIWTLATRAVFIYSHHGLTDPSLPSATASGFVAAWLAETLLVLVPGAGFLAANIRSLRPVPPPAQPVAVSRPSSRKSRT